jgi:hypothetical protein
MASHRRPRFLLNAILSAVALGSASLASAADDCSLSTVRCVGPGEEYNTNIANVEKAFQAAADAVNPGDRILIRGGTYQHLEASSSTNTFLAISKSGTDSQRITIEPYNGEKVVIKGFGYRDNADGPTRSDETLVHVTGDYITIRGLELSHSSRKGLEISGRYGLFENLRVHDCWETNIILLTRGKPITHNILRYIDTYRSRHGAGIRMVHSSTSPSELISDNIIENSIGYRNGYQENGVKVPPFDGDPAGGGNSDGFGAFKACHDNAEAAGVTNLCPRNIVRGNIAWHNADDGFDNSMSDGSKIINNISFDNGPTGNKGFKTLRNVKGLLTYSGNVALDNPSNGIEMRAATSSFFAHNLSATNGLHGLTFSFDALNASATKIVNNLGMNNAGSQDIWEVSGVTTTNWAEDKNGNPKVANMQFMPNVSTIEFNTSMTVAQKVANIRQQFASAFSPVAGSPLIDAGTFIAGYHCATADDNPSSPMPLGADCRHWRGSKPDIGAYEFGSTDPDDAPTSPSLQVQ